MNDLKLFDVVRSLGFMKEIDPTIDTSGVMDQCIDRYIEAGGTLGELENRIFQVPDYVMEKIRERLDRKQERYPISEVMEALAGSNSWNPANMMKLDQYSEDDFYHWMISEESDNLLRLIGVFIERFDNGKNDLEKTVIEKLEGALDKISDRSQLDQLRIEKFIGYRKNKN